MREYKYEWGILYLKCNKCWKFLTIENYNKDRIKQFWVRSDCKDCRREYRKPYYEMNKSKILERWKTRVMNNKNKVDGYKKKYRELHRDRVAECAKSNRIKNSDKLWFNWDTFHQRAMQYVRKNKLRPDKCPICWSNRNIVMHHPSYDNYDDWRIVVFCCQNCHKGIHSWRIKCPTAINLINLRS